MHLRKGKQAMVRRAIVARYDYTDAHGTLLYRVFRYEPKGFAVRSVAGQEMGQDGRYPRVPYRIIELLSADPSRPVFIVEGEKDVDRLYAEGAVATCNAFGGGKGKWTAGHSRFLRQRHVVILPDNDRTGEEHGRCIAKELQRKAASLKLIQLPALPPKGDISDWLDAGNTMDDLYRLVDAAPVWRRETDGREPLPEPDWARNPDSEYSDLRVMRDTARQIYGLPLPPAEKLLMLLLSEYSGPTQEELAPYIGVTPRRVRQMIRALVARGYLRRARIGRKNRYSVHPGYGT